MLICVFQGAYHPSETLPDHLLIFIAHSHKPLLWIIMWEPYPWRFVWGTWLTACSPGCGTCSLIHT